MSSESVTKVNEPFVATEIKCERFDWKDICESVMWVE